MFAYKLSVYWRNFRAQSTGAVDIGDLTWEQKEKVLRYLFSRMNGVVKPLPVPSKPTGLENAQQLAITHSGKTAG